MEPLTTQTQTDTSLVKVLLESAPIQRWYVFRSKPRAEGQCLEEFSKAGVESFCPMVMEYRYRRRRTERAPLFPGYVFARFAWPDDYHEVRWLKGVSHIVRFGDGDPPFVADELVNYFMQRTNSDGVLDMTEEFRPGDPVVILSEPFRGLVGQIVRADSSTRRIVVLMEFLSQATIQIEACQIRAL